MPTIALIFLLVFSAPLAAQVSVSGGASISGAVSAGGPVISGLTQSADANSVLLTWTTDVASTTYAYCGSQSSLYDASQNSVTSHSIPVPQLSPSTAYTCEACSSGSCQSIAATTTATPTSTPITGITLGTVTNYNTGALHPMIGDIFWNTVGSDGTTYITTGDSGGWDGSTSCTYAAVVGKFTASSPIAVSNVNVFSGWPGCVVNSSSGLQNLGYPHPWGITSIGGKLFLSITDSLESTSVSSTPLFYGSMLYSADHGATWNSQSSPATFNATPTLNSPWNLTLWPNGPPYFSASNFVLQGADDGTLGYAVADNRVLNANAYVYGMAGIYNYGSNTGQSTSAAADSIYLWRVPRSQLADLKTSEYQYYIGGDGTQASAWSNTQTAAQPILTNDCNGTNLPGYPGCLGDPSVAYIPALNRYLMVTYYWDNGPRTPANTHWLFYEAPAPWGTWTLIQTMTFTNGAYNPVILQADALSATFASTQIRILWSENWLTGNQNLFYATMTVTH